MIRSVHQAVPLAILFALAVAALVFARQLLVPDTFGKYGHYRGAAEQENMEREIAYAGSNSCADCHDEIADLKHDSNHRTVACEVCHGPAAPHIEDPEEFIPVAPRGRGYCPLCHGYNASRPTGFPQILAEYHNPGKPCMSCHSPHDPVLPRAPEECSACHRQISSQKMVSHHALLSCMECHEVPDDHWTNPRIILALKPNSKATCGKCHATDATSSKDIPRVDMELHGERYLCWECHYPHFPEANK